MEKADDNLVITDPPSTVSSSEVNDYQRDLLAHAGEGEDYIPLKQFEAHSNELEAEKMMEQVIDTLGLKGENMHSFVDKSMWARIIKYIEENLEEFLKDGALAITFQMKYMLCCYFVLFIPAEAGFLFPRQIVRLVPKEARKIKAVQKFMTYFETFLEFIKKENDEGVFVVNVIFGRSNAVADDIKQLVYRIRNAFKDPAGLMRWALEFEVRNRKFKEFLDAKRKKGLIK